jgi:uncharacterized protein (UPF0297 family)
MGDKMENSNINMETVAFPTNEVKRDQVKEIFKVTREALEERGYSAVNQITGYLISNDPAYISSHKGARKIIQSLERYEIIEELVRFYLEQE